MNGDTPEENAVPVKMTTEKHCHDMKPPTAQTITAGNMTHTRLAGSLALNLDDPSITLTERGNLALNIEGAFSLNRSENILGNPAIICMDCEGSRPLQWQIS